MAAEFVRVGSIAGNVAFEATATASIDTSGGTTLYAAIFWNGTQTFSGATYDGAAMSLVAVEQDASITRRCAIYKITTGLGATANIVATWSASAASANVLNVVGVVFSGGTNTGTADTNLTTGGLSVSNNTAVSTSDANGKFLTVAIADGSITGSTPSGGSNHTNRAVVSSQFQQVNMIGSADGGSSQTLTWSWTGTSEGSIAVAPLDASGGANDLSVSIGEAQIGGSLF